MEGKGGEGREGVAMDPPKFVRKLTPMGVAVTRCAEILPFP